jgi:hypothetical protein
LFGLQRQLPIELHPSDEFSIDYDVRVPAASVMPLWQIGNSRLRIHSDCVEGAGGSCTWVEMFTTRAGRV